MSGYRKISVNLSEEVLGAARELMESKNMTMTEVLRRAISTRALLEAAQADGKHVLLRDPKTKETERVIFE